MIKSKPPYPFETIALAVSFSPGLKDLVEEMNRLCRLHGSMAIFIHVGKRTGEKQRELSSLLIQNGFNDANSRIYWEQEDVVKSILHVCKQEVVDLLLMGASERENFKVPAGRTAREVAVKAKCSVLIYACKPSGGFRKVILNGARHKKTDHTIQTAIYLSEKENVPEISVIEYAGEQRVNDFAEASATSHVNRSNASVALNYVSGDSGVSTTLSEYAFQNNADLIITNSTDHAFLIFERVTGGNDITEMLKELNGSLLIVHSRISE